MSRYYVKVKLDGKWEDSGEGPWDRRQDAVDFARAEVGVPWRISTRKSNPMKRSKRAAKARLRKLARVFERAIIPKDVLQQHRSMERRNLPKIKGRKVKAGGRFPSGTSPEQSPKPVQDKC